MVCVDRDVTMCTEYIPIELDKWVLRDNEKFCDHLPCSKSLRASSYTNQPTSRSGRRLEFGYSDT